MKDLHLSHIVVWVTLPGLPYMYYNKDLFRAIAGAIGQAVKIDYNTIVGRRRKFVTLAVVVDLRKPLISCIGIDNFLQRVEYDGLLFICYECGC
uniref:Uncharacterized protein n=1 Tax=Gossypium raimondii TaxID=29730 RepID=A0A0D2QZE5_GOSRA|nr:hypothetical protein B456_010G222800 [Gossypium raimondii]